MYELKVVRERTHEYGELAEFRGSSDVYAAFREHFARADREQFFVLLLDNKHRALGFHLVSVGSLTASVVHPREVFKAAILTNAAAMICLHNHPSNDPTPSREDIELTRRLRECADLLGIRLLDHVIIGDGKYVSFVDDGYW